jgi:quercetin 2,3-dioxygenase
LDAGASLNYTVKKEGNGVYVFIIEGEAEVAGEKLNRRDAIGITDFASFDLKASADARILVMDVPMIELT